MGCFHARQVLYTQITSESEKLIFEEDEKETITNSTHV